MPIDLFQWYHGKNCIDNDSSYNITYNNGEAILVKTRISPKDEGEYSCVASNVAGSVTTRARMAVKCTYLASLLLQSFTFLFL